MKKIIILLTCAILLCGCGNGNMVKSQKKTQNNEQKYTSELFAMDTYMEITAYGDNAKEAVAKASARINELDGMLSTGNSDSEVSKLNSEKELKLSEDVGNIMERSLEISESTGGVFNPAIYPIMQLWGFDTKNYKVPNKKELESTLKNINESKIKYDSKTRVAKLDKKMKIDFGGIAKGYTSSEVMKVFKDNGIKSGLVSLGGNVQALGAKPDGSKWKVAVQNPDSDESYIGVLEIAGKAVITSGGYERYFEKDGKTYHHIIDPATGYPADSGLKSVTIISSDGTLADGLSTSLFIMGIDKAKEYWRANSDKFDAILLTNDNKQYVTEGIYSDYSTDYPVEKMKIIMNNLKLTKKKDLILAAVIIVIAIVMYIIMNQMQSDNGEIVKITVDGNVYGTYSLTKNQEIEIKTDKGKNIVWIHDNCVEMKEADCPDKYCVKQGKITKTRQNIVCLPHKVVVEIAVSDNTKGNEADVIAK